MKTLYILIISVLLISCQKETISKNDITELNTTGERTYSIVNNSDWLLDLDIYNQAKSNMWRTTLSAHEESVKILTTESEITISWFVKDSVNFGIKYKLISGIHNTITITYP